MHRPKSSNCLLKTIGMKVIGNATVQHTSGEEDMDIYIDLEFDYLTGMTVSTKRH